MGKRTRLAWLLLYIMLSAVPPAKPSACPTCTRGVGPEACKDGQYWSQRNRVGMCNDCTAPCHDNRNMIEVNPCTKISDRKCQCKAGYYCPSPVKQTCRRACEPCESGFTGTSNLNRSCERYTHCASLGMVVIKEGSRTSDHVCRNLVLTVITRVTRSFSPSETSEESPSEKSPSEESPSEESPSEKSPSEKSPSEESPSEESPSEESPSEESPSEESPSEKSPSEESPSEKSPSEKSPSEESPSEKSPSEESPSEESPSEKSPSEESPSEESPSEESPSEKSPSEKSPSEESPSEESPSEESPSEKSPSEESPSEESPSEKSPSEESPSEESPSEESPSEKSPSEKSPSEESPSEESPSEESPSEKSLWSESVEVTHTPKENEGLVSPSQPLSKTTWICFLLLFIFLLCLMSCLSLKCKGKAIKNKLKWAGLGYRSCPRFPTASPNPNVETSGPGYDVTESVQEFQGRGSFPGKNQQVTMEHVGKADGINNTVGSIFIYSPGMVILGSNSNEKKEEAETSGDDGGGGGSGEDTRLMSVPQQESSSEEDSVRFATQEELGKELSIPIPATSK